MSFPAYGTAPIRCDKRKCGWRGYETERASVQHPTIKCATQSACPLCKSTNYYFMTAKEIAAWKPVAPLAANPSTGAGQ
jgi:hypothetical protein